MSIYDRFFDKEEQPTEDFAIPSHLTAKELGKVNVRKGEHKLQVQFTILMAPEGEGWRTGVALDASASMTRSYGKGIVGKIPPEVEKRYLKKRWLKSYSEDGKTFHSLQKKGYEDAVKQGYLKATPNIVQSEAQKFITYFAANLDANASTTIIYWAAGNGSEIEILGDFTEAQCRTLEISGPTKVSFGSGTSLNPAVKFFAERFTDAPRSIYVFITDGKLDDLNEVKEYSIKLAKDIESGKRNLVKCVLIGIGDEIDASQLEALDDLDTGTDIDIWDHKIIDEMRALEEIFAEVVNENQIIAPTGKIYDSEGKVIKQYTDGLPTKILFSMPVNNQWFELEVGEQRIRQTVINPKN
ncbi:MAG: vWA domain-containing protein [Xenococcus sp. (in: cyanobacteria)]